MAEYYCADDFFNAVQAAMASWNGNVTAATPAQVAQAWGRGNPGTLWGGTSASPLRQ